MSHLIITGASRGIGYAITQKFLEAGWQAVNLSRHASADPRIKHITYDLADVDNLLSLQASLEAFLHGAKRICLVHNAAAHDHDSITTIDPIAMARALAINLITPTQLNKILVPMMNTGDSILYIGSTLSEKAVAGAASYVIAKHGVVGMMRATCQDLANQQIHSCCICPGFTDTEMLRSHLHQDQAIIEAVKSRVGAKRLIEPQEIADVVWFASQNPVLNGAVIHANLGQIES